MPKNAIILPDRYNTPKNQIQLISGSAQVQSFHDLVTEKRYVVIARIPTDFIFYVHNYPGWTAHVDGVKKRLSVA